MRLPTYPSGHIQSLKNAISAVVAVLCGIAFLITPSPLPRGTHPGSEISSRTCPDGAYQQAIHDALAAGSDQLQDWFNVVRTVRLQAHLKGISRVAFSGSRIVTLDNSEPGVYLFSASGKLERRLGRRGAAPGEFINPVDVAFGPDFIAVVDFTIKRVNLFSSAGAPVRSFVYSPEFFSAQRLSFHAPSNQFFLFGNRRHGTASNPSVTFVHRYRGDGQFEGSTFELPRKACSLHFDADDAPMIEATPGDGAVLRFMLPWDSKLYSLSADGQATIAFDSAHEAVFRPPTSPLNLDRPSLAIFQHWVLSWTPIVGFAVDKDLFLVETQCFSPQRYRLEIWSLADHVLLGSLVTNRWLLGRTRPGSYMFLEGFPERPTGSDYAILETQLRAR